MLSLLFIFQKKKDIRTQVTIWIANYCCLDVHVYVYASRDRERESRTDSSFMQLQKNIYIETGLDPISFSFVLNNVINFQATTTTKMREEKTEK